VLDMIHGLIHACGRACGRHSPNPMKGAQVLGHTLPEIAAEKAGIFKRGAPALTVPQRPDAMQTLVVRGRARPALIPLAASVSLSGVGLTQRACRAQQLACCQEGLTSARA